MNERGQLTITHLLYVLIIGGALFLVANVAPFYYNYFAIENEMIAQARKADTLGIDKMRKYLLKKMERLDIPIDNDGDLRIYREGETVRIEYTYYEYLEFEWDGEIYDLHEFEFNIQVEEKIDRSKSKVW